MAPLTLTILVSMLRMHGADATITSLSAIVASPPEKIRSPTLPEFVQRPRVSRHVGADGLQSRTFGNDQRSADR